MRIAKQQDYLRLDKQAVTALMFYEHYYFKICMFHELLCKDLTQQYSHWYFLNGNKLKMQTTTPFPQIETNQSEKSDWGGIGSSQETERWTNHTELLMFNNMESPEIT